MSNESYISHGRGGTTFAGPDAVNYFRAATLRSGLGLLKVGIRPTRGLTVTRALKLVTEYTGKKYKRTEIDIARADLTVWIDAMRCALPIESRE
jgi:hypothetical protein